MRLSSGSRLGAYEVIAPIGAGGMGEVYRARDSRLKRDVALKVLSANVADDKERLARFQREATLLAALNHPNIAQLHGLEESNGVTALVMELVDGENLSRRIARGPVPIDEALPIAMQIVDALEAAHRQGIIHRDLKPANVVVRPDGTVKVLDFGLAKAMEEDAEGSSVEAITSPAMTIRGVIVGTAAYMSPEQARGKVVDKRTDIWAFGVVLFEMLAGRRPLDGETTTDVMAAIVKSEPDWPGLPPSTPAPILRLLRHTLVKDARRRLADIGDARFDLEDAARPTVVPPAHRSWRPLWIAAAALALLAVAGVTTFRRTPPADRTVVRSEVAFSMPVAVWGERSFAIHPDGSEIVFVSGSDPNLLYRRRLADEDAVAIAGTEGSTGPFFSPDGRWLAFSQRGRLKKMPAAGGGPIDLGEGGYQGGSFAPDGSVIFNLGHGDRLIRVSESGAERTNLTTVAADKGEAGHHWPQVLPGGTHVLFTTEVNGKSYSDARIELLSLATGERRVLIEGGTDARYVATGHLLYWRQGEIWRVPFDLQTLRLTGAGSVALRNVAAMRANGNAQFAVADNGTLVYMSGSDPSTERNIAVVDRAGAARALSSEQRAFEWVAVSPDARRLATTIIDANDDLWTVEVGRPALTRITYEGENSRPVWSPDGKRLAFTRHEGGQPPRLFMMPADGGAPELIRESGGRAEATGTWSPSGVLAFVRVDESRDIWVVNVDGDRKARAFVSTPFDEAGPRFSPDGRWLAYVSNESGRFEVYVRAYPGPGPAQRVSSDGGDAPRWRGDGRELFYRNGGQMMVVAVAGATAPFSPPRVLFKEPSQSASVVESWGRWDVNDAWDVMPDGRSFVMVQILARPRHSLSIVQNWFQELERR